MQPRGGRFQILAYVTRRPGELERAIGEALPELADSTYKWTCPEDEELQDAAFLKAIGAGRLAPRLKAFWPKPGPTWSAAAKLDGDRAVLVEAASAPGELRGPGPRGLNTQELSRVRSALSYTQGSLGLEPAPDRWTRTLYDPAARLAHLQFLRDAGVEAWLVQVCFLNDARAIGSTQTDWERALETMNRELGLEDVDVPHTVRAFLPAV